MKKKFSSMTIEERRAFWISLSKERRAYFINMIIGLVKVHAHKSTTPQVSYEMTDKEKRARGGWGNWTSH